MLARCLSLITFPRASAYVGQADNWNFYVQPSGMKEALDKNGNVLDYAPNTGAENAKNMLESTIQI